MNLIALLYLGITFGLFVIFALIVLRTYRRKNKERGEAPKFTMLDDE